MEHVFDVVRIRERVQVRCHMCGWLTGYDLGDAEGRDRAKAAAMAHREDRAWLEDIHTAQVSEEVFGEELP